MSVYSFYRSGITDGSVSLDLRDDGRIKGIAWACYTGGSTDGQEWAAEISFGSTAQTTTNDTNNVIDGIGDKLTFVTSGLKQGLAQRYTSMDVPVQAGERLYMHVDVGATAPSTLVCRAFVYVDDKISRASPKVRR